MADQEMKAAKETYSEFLGVLKTSTIVAAIVAVFVVILIS